MSGGSRAAAVVALAVAAVATGLAQAGAAVFTVNSTADVVDANPGDGVCETAPGNGVCSLRAAIQEANAAGAGQINVPAGTYTLTIAGLGADAAAGDLDISGNVTVTGAGAATTIIQACTVDQKSAPCADGQGIVDRVLQVLPGATVTITGVTIRNGYASSAGVAYAGAILNGGTLTLIDAAVTANRADLSGGAIVNGRWDASGTLTLTNTTVSANLAALQGGGLFNFPAFGIPIGTITLSSSTVADNTASDGAGIASGQVDPPVGGTVVLNNSVITGNDATNSGGGILISGGTLTLVNSTVAANVAGTGGGIFYTGGSAMLTSSTLTNSTVSGNATTGNGAGIFSASSVLTITNSTISGNTSTNAEGGGLYNLNGTLTLTDSTISGNTALAAGGFASFGISHPVSLNGVTISNNVASSPSGVGGGGILLGNGNPTTLKNTLLAGNFSSVGFPECSSGTAVTSLGFNLIGDGTGCDGITGGVNGDLVGTSDKPIAPLLAPLGNYGGATLTHALLAGSPAIDAGDPAGCTDALGNLLLTDQRGEPRTLDGNGDGVARCDIGAFELGGTDSRLSVSGLRPTHAGNSGSVVVLLYGSGFASGMTVRFSRAGEPDIPVSRLTIDESGAAAAMAIDLAGEATGVWDVIITKPDGESATLAGAFTVETGGAPQLWAELVHPKAFRVGVPASFFLVFGNRGNVDAFDVPLGLSVPTGFPFTPGFPITPPPTQAGQVATDWSRVPITAANSSTGPTAIPLLLPVVPAAFTGVLSFTLTPTGGGAFDMTFGIGSPYLQPDLDPRVVSALLQGAQAYAQRVYGATTFSSQAAREQYATTQLDAVANLGLNAMVDSVGTGPQVYSLAQLLIDLAQFTASNQP